MQISKLLTNTGKELPRHGVVGRYFRDEDKVVIVYQNLKTIAVKMKDGELIKLMGRSAQGLEGSLVDDVHAVNERQKKMIDAMSETARQNFAMKQKRNMLRNMQQQK